jgi:hypothetical protein
VTLSGNRDRRQRAEDARAAWKEKHDAQLPRRPWVMPLMVGVAVAVLVACLAVSFANGWLF